MKRVKRLGLYTFLLCCIMFAVLLSGCSEDAPAADESSIASESVSDSVSESGTESGEPGGEDDPDGHVCKGESWVVESEATCTEDGKEVFKCSCGKTVKTKKIPALGHDKIAHEAQAVTCDEDGWDAYETCTRCDYTTYAKIAALGHTKELRMAEAPTCTDIGWNEYEVCTREGCGYTTYVEIPALGHDEVSHEAKAPTCDEAGFDAYVECSRCDYTTRGEDKAALGHNLSTVPAQAPTCTEVGWNKHKVCSRCDYSTMVEKAALGHDPVAHNGQEATCLVEGWDAYETCSRCDYTTRGANYFADHSYNSDELCRWCSRVYGSQGLQYQTNGDGTCILVGIGDCTDTVLEIPYKSPEGDVITSIGAGAFRGCTQLTKVKFNPRSNGVTKIAAGAFDGCTALTEFEASARITSVGKDAFAGCTALLKVANGVSYVNSWVVDANTALSTVEISATATLIADGALENCTALTALTVPANIKYIGFGAFRGCSSLASITLPFVGATAEGTENRHFGYVFGAASYLGNADVHPSVLKTVTVTNAKTIPANAFNGCKVLTTVNVNEAVDSFGAYAFAGCSKLTALNVTLGAITEIPQGLLEGCAAIESLFEIPSTVTAIGDSAFSGCEELTALTFASDCQLATIGDSAFEKCEVLASITLPTGVTSIGTRAFNGCKKLEAIEFPASVTSIGAGVLGNCTALEEITVALGNEVYSAVGNCLIELATKTLLAGCQASVIPTDGSVTAIGDEAFSGQTGLTEIVIPASVVSIGDSAFQKCTKVTSVTFAKDNEGKTALTTIGEYAFSGITATNFKTLTIPASVTTIGAHAFDGCTKITTVTFAVDGEGKTALTTIGEYAFSGITASKFTTLTIPASVTTIGAYAFKGCTYLSSMTFPAGVTSIGDGVLAGCQRVASIAVEAGNTVYKAEGHCLIEISTKTLVAGCQNSVIPTGGSVTVIGKSAFEASKNLAAITIPEGIVTIGESAFSGCNKLTSLTIPSTVVTIGDHAFDSAAKIGTVTFAGTPSLKTIGDYAFYSIKLTGAIKTITIPASVEVIGDYAFASCVYLVTVTVAADTNGKGNLTTIGESAFDGCLRMTSFTLSGDAPLASVGALAFNGCKVLTSIALPASIRTIGADAFAGCAALTFATLPFVGGSADGEENTALLYVFGGTLPANLKTLTVLGGDRIAAGAFDGCSGLTTLTISGVNTIEAGALNACTALTSLSVPFVGENASGTGKTYFGAIFGGDDNTRVPTTLATVTVTGGEQIAANAFLGCANIASLTLPETLLGIGNYAFNGCEKLTAIALPKSVESVGAAIFANCPSLASITVASENAKYTAVNNCLIELATNTLVAGCKFSVIPTDGSVTAIASGAFEDCTGLTSIVIPDSVTSIGYGAFKACTALASITVPFVGNTEYPYFGYIFGVANAEIPATLTTVTVTGGEHIAANAFLGCANVVSLTLPETLLGIGDHAFSGCESLTAIAIPKSVASVGTGIFANCPSLASITVASENAKYTAVNNCLIELATNTLVAGCKTSVIPTDGSVTAIASGAFEDCTGLTSVVIPDSVTSIGYGAFKGCTALTSITVPFVGNTEYAYFGYIFATENAAIPATLTTVTVTGGEQIAASAFEGCANIASLTLPETLLGIGNYAFRGCESLTAIAIPKSVASVGAGVFANCTSLASITVASENETYAAIDNCLIELATKTLIAGCNTSVLPVDGSVVAIGAYAFEGTGIVSIVIPECITSIGIGAFKGCASLAEITLPYIGNGANKLHLGYIFGAETAGENAEFVPASLKKVILTAGTEITANAFANCIGIVEIVLPTGIVAVGENAFKGCASLTTVNVEELTALTTIGKGAFANCSALSAIVIPDSVTGIGFGAFLGCDALASIELPFVGNRKNGNANLHFGYIFGAETAQENADFVPASLKLVTVTGGESIAAAAFKGCASITKIVIPNSVTSIGFGAFEGCSALTSVTLPFVGGASNATANAHFAYVFGATFYYYSENYVPTTLTNVVITGGNSVASFAFWGCDMIESIVLPESLASIGYGAFYGCDALREMTLPFVGNTPDGGANSYFGYIFGAWKHEAQKDYVPETLTKVTVTGGVLTAGAFADCDSIQRLVIGVAVIGEGAFDGFGNLGGVELIEGVEVIGEGAFANSSLTEITVPASVTSIGKNAFYGCSSLTRVIFADGSLLASIGEGAFSGCTALDAVSIPAGVTSIGAYAFADCESLANVSFASTSVLATIGEGAFRGCELLEDVTIPASVTALGNSAFEGCTGLLSAAFANGIQLSVIGDRAFAGCTALTAITIPASVTTLGNGVLEGCEGLLTLTFDDNAQLSVIGNRAFADCASLTTIKIPSSVTSIGAGAFNGCASLVNVEGSLVSERYAIVNGCLIETDAENGTVTLIRGNDTTVIPNDLGITHIANGAFKNCTGLTSVTIPATVVSIGNEAFMGCSALATLTFADNSALTAIGASAFENCELLTSVTIPASVASLGDRAFMGCSALATLTFADNSALTAIGASAFENCALTGISIPAGVTVIGNRAFYYCRQLATLTFAATAVLETIGEEAFGRCSQLTAITLPASLVNIGKNAFDRCLRLTSVTFAVTEGWVRYNDTTRETMDGLDDAATAANKLRASNYAWERTVTTA